MAAPPPLPDKIEICPTCHAGILFRQFDGPKGCYCAHCGARADNGIVFTKATTADSSPVITPGTGCLDAK